VQEYIRALVVGGGPELNEVAHEAASLYSWRLSFTFSRDEAMKKAITEEPDIIILGSLETEGEAFRLNRELKRNPDTEDIAIVVVYPEERADKGFKRHIEMRLEAEDHLYQPITARELASSVEEILMNIGVLDIV
jgi:PleD family two-component response regulator